MKIAFLADPLDSFKIYKDSTYAMMCEAAERGYTIYAFEPSDMAFVNNAVNVTARLITLTPNATNWYQAAPQADCPLTFFDVTVVRKDPPVDMEYVYCTHLLELAQNGGAQIVNRPEAIRNHNEKLAIAQFPDLIAPTIVTNDIKRLQQFHHEHRDIILKPLDGMGGMGIFRIKDDGLNLNATIELLSRDGKQSIMAQRYIPAIKEGDKRVLLINGTVVPFALARIPQTNEVRGNLAAGGIGVAQPLSAKDLSIAEKLAPILSKRGLFLVGLDIIGEYLTEINVTSPTCFQEINQQTGCNVAALFIDALENFASNKTK